MTSDTVIKNALGDRERHCLWQIVPRELPANIPPMALELWRTPSDGALHLFQLFVRDRGNKQWYRDVFGSTHFVMAPICERTGGSR